MRPGSSTLFSRALAVALLIGMGAVLYAVIIEPLWSSHQNFRQSRISSTEKLAKYQQIARAVNALEAELAALQIAQTSQAGYLPGDSSALAAAELQTLVKNIVRAAGEDLRSTQILPVKEEAGVTRVAIRVQLPVRIQSLQEVLHTLESGVPFIFIDNVDVRRRKTSRRLKNTNQEVYLDVRFDITGYMRSPET